MQSVNTNVTTTKNNKLFQFGDGKIVKSLKKVTLPAEIKNIKCKIMSEVVNTDISVLLIKSSLKEIK